jgi:hypothetical protein
VDIEDSRILTRNQNVLGFYVHTTRNDRGQKSLRAFSLESKQFITSIQGSPLRKGAVSVPPARLTCGHS